MAKFFVSYSRSVKDEVHKVIDLLIASGHDVWWDGDIPVMADWWATILEKIEWCDVFIFVASLKSVESPYCLAELKYASDRQRPILPFMLEGPAILSLPPTLPSRGQWLLYNGDAAQMLTQINDAYHNINWELHKDIPVRRPAEPMTGGKSLARQFQEARQLANSKEFDTARVLFANIKRLDYGEWGIECDEWLVRLSSYEGVMDLVDADLTLPRARTAWTLHIRKHGREFDPHEIGSKLRQVAPARSRLPYIRIISAVGGIILIITLVVPILNSRQEEPLSSTVTDDRANLVEIEADAERVMTPTSPPNKPLTPITTVNGTKPTEIEADSELAATVAGLPEGCIVHTLADGESPFILAEQYETSIEAIFAANALTEEDAAFLQIGQVLVIPLENCPFVPIGSNEEKTTGATETPAETPTPTITATITLPPTAVDAQVQIVEVIAPGDVTTEAVVLRNNGRNVSLTGWTISDAEGNTYTFPERNLFSNGEITLYTGVGQSTPVVAYWGRDQAVWGEPGEVVTLSDANGVVQASFRVPSAVNLG